MKGIEKQVLSIIKKVEEADKESISVKLGISTQYAGELCSILVRDGYLQEKSGGTFGLTP